MAVSHEVAAANFEALKQNPYPGRGLVLGMTATEHLAQVYWVMGRSEDSRNRVLIEEEGVVRTDVLDESAVTPEKLDLIKYNALRTFGSKHIVSNGKQTDDIAKGVQYGESFSDVLSSWEYEPDAPNFTPRISGIIDSGFASNYEVSLIRNSAGDEPGEPVRSSFRGALRSLPPGVGRGLHTYQGDGNPLPPFSKSPLDLPLGKDIVDTAEMYWDALNPENRVALVVKGIDAKTGVISHHIINAREA